MRREIAFAGGGYMVGVIAGALLAVGLAGQTASPGRAPSPQAGRNGWHLVEFFDNPKNVARVWGALKPGGVLSWEPSDQEFDPPPATACRTSPANQWVEVRVNGNRINVWGWKNSGGAVRWCIEDVRSVVADDAPTGATTTAKVKPGVDVPAAGVVVGKLEPGKVTASDPALAAEARALMETNNAPCNPDSKPPSKIPTPPIPSTGFDWTLLIKVVFLAFAVVVGVAFCLAAAWVAFKRSPQQP